MGIGLRGWRGGEAVADGELELAAGAGGGGLAEAGGTEGSDVAGVVGAVEDVEGGEAGGKHTGVIVVGLGEVEVVGVEEVEGGYSAALKGVAANAGGAGVAEASVEVVGTGGLVVGRAGVESGVDAKGEPVIWVYIAGEVEGLKAVLAGTAPLVVGMVLVLGEPVDAASVAFEARERVLSLAGEDAAGLSAEAEVEGVEERAAAGFDLLDLAVVEIRARVVGREAGVWREDGRVGVAGAEALDLDLTAIGGGEGDSLVDLALDAGTVLERVRGADIGVEADDAGGRVASLGLGSWPVGLRIWMGRRMTPLWRTAVEGLSPPVRS